MAKTTTSYRCTECGWMTGRWVGRCGQCQAWGSLSEGQTQSARAVASQRPAQPALRITEVEPSAARGVRTGPARVWPRHARHSRQRRKSVDPPMKVA